MKKKITGKNIIGTVIAESSDRQAKVKRLSLLTEGGHRLLIETNRIGVELQRFIDHKVAVTGKFRERIDGKTAIRLKNYKLFKITDDDRNTDAA